MKEISNAEFEVLEVLWRNSPLSANDVVEALSGPKEWHEKTVKTLLNRLVKKQAVGFTKDGRRYLYHPLLEREDYTGKVSKSLVDRLFSGRLSPLVAGFANQKNLSKQDVEELKQLIAQWEKDND